MGIIAFKGLGKAYLKKADDTIKSLAPKLGKEDTKAYKFNLMKKNLSKNQDKMIKFRNEKSKQILKGAKGEKRL